MGYTSRVTGRIKITPPISKVEKAKFDWDGCYDLSLSEDGTTLTPPYDDYKAYNLEQNLQGVVNTYSDHAFSGRLEVYGEDSTDIWCLTVTSKVVKVETTVERAAASIRWPDGSEVTSVY